MLIQLSVPGLELRGEPEVGSYSIKTLLFSQHIRGDPKEKAGARSDRERERDGPRSAR